MSEERKRAAAGPSLLRDALKGWMTQSGLGERIGQAEVIVDWPRLVGEGIAAVTEPESITPDGLLRVRVATAAWANELSLMTPQIMARINAGRAARIRGIRWLAGTNDPHSRRGHGT